ncbi:DEAD/DEAH box helicase [Paracoccus sp. 228]|uniref:DEAD/DEAH box helicase n=1 Tax=Paracoccus sp. 228 TaxID=1192054 RepID=UPI0005FA502A|nr:DEAD/DEAH box helicase [Paracoccus sp. 228]
MTELNFPAPLQAALADKGYETLTAVQSAVLAPEAAGRDVLVSAQTGSGKTVAFGLAMGADLLDGDRIIAGELPLALAIAPTRELALQVARELEWLYAGTGAQIATCVGGMDYRNEKRALQRGAQIVVGTPGRLRDHIDRGSLDLSDLRAAVLDEADEMLDLGFREDLEFILGAAPVERRTLMFSATVPSAIEKLARDFQRDALRIAAMGEARQHGDIAYRAYTVTARDREPAIFNLLRIHEAQTAIVFCKTRANVNHLLARMSNRGFKCVALSGELSQQERTHALQALRDGRARVCIATDVAARGIDLPGLELVIHADLPTNPDTMLHRSGRTGRAGSKGVSALIVPSADYRRAQRLLQNAKVSAEWLDAPTADEVRARDDQRMLDHPGLREPVGDDAALAAQLLEQFSAEQVAAAFLRLWREGRPAAEELSEAHAPPAPMAPRAQREFGPSVWFTLSVGHSGRAEARWLLPKVCDAGGITRDSIGAIRVKQDLSYIQIASEVAAKFGDFIEITPEVTMRRMDGAPDLDAPIERAPRAPRTDNRSEGRKPAPRAKHAASDEGHHARVKSARGGWLPDDAPAEPRETGPHAAVKSWKKKSSADAGKGPKPAWAKSRPAGDKAGAPKAHRKGPKRPA